MLQVANKTITQVDRIGCSSFDTKGKGDETVESNDVPLLEELTLCVACMEQVANVVFIPCGHSVICEYCLCMLDNQLCPCCREQVLSFNLLPIKTKTVEDCALSIPSEEYCPCPESGQENNSKVSEYLEQYGIGNQLEEAISPPRSILQFVGTSEGQQLGWFCYSCHNYHSRQQVEASLMYPLERLIQQRNEHERNIVKSTLQIWVCGSSFQINERLIELLSSIFPVDASYGHKMENTKRNHKISKEATKVINKSLRKLPLLELGNKASSKDNCPILSHDEPPVNICFQCRKYSSNCVFEGRSICFRNIRTWELLRLAKLKDSWYTPDLLLYCCYNDNEQSFYDILGLKRRLRDRYGFICKELLVLLENSGVVEHFKYVPQHQDQTCLTIDSIQKLLKEYELHRADLFDVLYVNLEDDSTSTFRALMKTIVRRAKVQRKQLTRNRSWISINTSSPTVVNSNRNRNVGALPVSNSCRCM